MAQRDLDARLALWSTREPVTLFGGGGACMPGSEEVRRKFRTAVRGTSRAGPWLRLVRGWWRRRAGLHRVDTSTSRSTPSPVQDYTLRVTYLYRRKNGEWKIIHRHGDYLRE